MVNSTIQTHNCLLPWFSLAGKILRVRIARHLLNWFRIQSCSSVRLIKKSIHTINAYLGEMNGIDTFPQSLFKKSKAITTVMI